MHLSIQQDVDVYRDIRNFNDHDATLLAREDKIDIAIDLQGYTNKQRSQIFVNRAAPIQINYLGYPGTMGAGFMDYIIADKIIINVMTIQITIFQLIFYPYDVLLYRRKLI